MNFQSVDKEIIRVLQNYCRPRVLTGLVKELKQAEAFERKVVAKSKGYNPGLPAGSTVNRDKLDLLITFCEKTLEGKDVLEVLLRIGDLLKIHGELLRAEEVYTSVLNQGKERGWRIYVAEAYMRRGEVFCRQGRWEESTADLGQSKLIFRELDEHESIGRVENILGTSYAEQGKLKQATAFFERALDAFERSEQTFMAGSVLMNLGIIHNIAGDHDLALADFKRAQSHFEEVGDLNRLGELHHNTGMSYLSKASFNNAIKEFDASMTLSTKAGNINLFGLANLGKAHVHYRLNDLPIALKLVNGALEAFTECNDRLSIADGYKIKGMIFREMHKPSFAESYLSTSLRINLEMQNQLNAAETYFEMGVLERVCGKGGKSKESFENARCCFAKVGALGEVKRTEEEINKLRNGKE